MTQRLGTKEAAAFLGVAPRTLNNARASGKLCGKPTPGYRKLGKKCVYELEALQAWIDQFPEQASETVYD